jgi:hypothetical protein
MSVYSTDTLLITTYALKLTATVSGFTSVTDSVTFNLVVKHECERTTITPTAIGAYSYDMRSTSTGPIATLSWGVSNYYATPYTNICSALAYTLYNNDLTASDSTVVNIVSLDQLQVYTIDVSKVGTYNLRVVGAIDSYASSYTDFTLTVTDSCAANSVTPSSLAD